MDATHPSDPADPSFRLARDAYHHLVFLLSATLPPPPSDTAEDRARRDSAAIAQVAAFCPANAAEAAQAAQYVAANAQAMDCLQLARDPALDPVMALKCRAQAAAMMRQAQGALRLLLRTQTLRRTLEADNAAADRQAWTEYCASQMMQEARPDPAAAPGPGIASVDEAASPPPPLPPAEPDGGEPAACAAPPPDAGAAPQSLSGCPDPESAALLRRLGLLPGRFRAAADRASERAAFPDRRVGVSVMAGGWGAGG
ncbi:MAG: hypothetical protein AB7S57_01580 [Acetobacteraceae bacterium]